MKEIDIMMRALIIMGIFMAIFMGTAAVGTVMNVLSSIEATDILDNAHDSLETHTITDMHKYTWSGRSLYDTIIGNRQPKYPSLLLDEDSIKYEITFENGEIIGTNIDNLKIGNSYEMFIYRVIYNDKNIAWATDYSVEK